MTTPTVARHTESSRRLSLRADLAFWTLAGAVVAALSRPLSASWGAPRAVILGVGTAFAVLGPLLLLRLNRMRVTRGLVAAFVATNLVLAPLSLAAAAFGWLPLTGTGHLALGNAGVVMLVLGVWQLTAMRRPRD